MGEPPFPERPRLETGCSRGCEKKSGENWPSWADHSVAHFVIIALAAEAASQGWCAPNEPQTPDRVAGRKVREAREPLNTNHGGTGSVCSRPPIANGSNGDNGPWSTCQTIRHNGPPIAN